jgi:ketosteroid isomerase-like protein
MTSEPDFAHDNQILQDLIDAWASSVRHQDIEGVVAHHATDIVIYDVVAQSGPLVSTLTAELG